VARVRSVVRWWRGAAVAGFVRRPCGVVDLPEPRAVENALKMANGLIPVVTWRWPAHSRERFATDARAATFHRGEVASPEQNPLSGIALIRVNTAIRRSVDNKCL